jgi:pimeloyl-ACP methyl ester carboxylesterase
MDTRTPDVNGSVSRLGESGSGARLVMLRKAGGSVSKAAALLARDFKVVSLAGGAAAGIASELSRLGISEAAFVADTAMTPVAFELALAQPSLVQSIATLAPAPLPADLVSRLSGAEIHVQAFFGTADSTWPADAARTFCRAIQHCSLMYVFAAGLAPDDERPEAVAAALAEFARKREKFLVTGKSSQLYP